MGGVINFIVHVGFLFLLLLVLQPALLPLILVPGRQPRDLHRVIRAIGRGVIVKDVPHGIGVSTGWAIRTQISHLKLRQLTLEHTVIRVIGVIRVIAKG